MRSCYTRRGVTRTHFQTLSPRIPRADGVRGRARGGRAAADGVRPGGRGPRLTPGSSWPTPTSANSKTTTTSNPLHATSRNGLRSASRAQPANRTALQPLLLLPPSNFQFPTAAAAADAGQIRRCRRSLGQSDFQQQRQRAERPEPRTGGDSACPL